ncbi:MAG: ABC transporter permease subunit [Candidatus Portnoybacteria bacterium]|nr:ABC transporter permease subunit [Candidatus Portnoybacteria bacterium]
MRKPSFKIYASRWHLGVTLTVIILPFLFFLVFSRIAHITTRTLALHLLISFLRLFTAYIIAVLLAWIAAIAFYRGRRAAIALPIFDVLQSFPTFAALPLAALFWGKSNFTVIFFLVITIIWPIFFSTISSLKLMKRDWGEAVEISGLKGIDYLWNFLLPVTIPGLITGSIIGLGEGWEALVATEIIVGMRSGLGNFFQSFSGDTAVTAFGILGLLILIFTINKLVWLPLLEWSHWREEE